MNFRRTCTHDILSTNACENPFVTGTLKYQLVVLFAPGRCDQILDIQFSYSFNGCNLSTFDEVVLWQMLLDRFNSLVPGKFEWNFRYLVIPIISVIDGWGIPCELALRWMSLDLTDYKSTLVQVMAGAVRQQAITWANIDPDLCRHMASLGPNANSAMFWIMSWCCQTRRDYLSKYSHETISTTSYIVMGLMGSTKL